MDPTKRVVTSLPLHELWSTGGVIEAEFCEHLTREHLRELLASASAIFVVADVGHPLRWIPQSETCSFWKTNARDRVADPSGFRLSDFPRELAYVASRWASRDGRTLVVLECHH
jgi:hypothetical protein